MDIPLTIAIIFNKRSSGLETQYDTKNSLILNKWVKVRLHRDLRNCTFCQTFFDLESIKDERTDFRSKFRKVNPLYKNTVFQFSSELLDLKTIRDGDNLEEENNIKGFNNTLSVTGWKVFDYESDLIYYFIERRIFNVITRSKVVRSMGIQLTTDKGFEALNQYYEHYKKNECVKKAEIPDYLNGGQESFFIDAMLDEAADDRSV